MSLVSRLDSGIMVKAVLVALGLPICGKIKLGRFRRRSGLGGMLRQWACMVHTFMEALNFDAEMIMMRVRSEYNPDQANVPVDGAA